MRLSAGHRRSLPERSLRPGTPLNHRSGGSNAPCQAPTRVRCASSCNEPMNSTPRHVIEVDARGFEAGDHTERDLAGGTVGLLGAHLGADLADGFLEPAVVAERQVSGDGDPVTRDTYRFESLSPDPGRGGKLDPQLGQALLDGDGSPPWPILGASITGGLGSGSAWFVGAR